MSSAAAAREARLFGRGQRMLLHRKRVRAGNHVSYADNRTRRVYKPNVLSKRLESALLSYPGGGNDGSAAQSLVRGGRVRGLLSMGPRSARGRGKEEEEGEGVSAAEEEKAYLKLRVSSKALRCIERAGGLDEYLLFTSPEKRGYSRLADDLHSRLVSLWEEKHGVVFNRRAILHHQKRGKDYVSEMLRRHAQQAQAQGTADVVD